MTISEALNFIKSESSERAFRFIFDTQYERMFRTAFFYTKDDEMAREVVLDVFASIWNRRQTLIIPKDFGAYCFIAVKNMALNLIKKNPLSAHEELPQNMMADGSNPEQQIIDEEIFEHYEKVLYGLPDRCREIFIMAREDGMSYAEIAEKLNISTKTVDAQLQKATKLIRSQMEDFVRGNAAGGHSVNAFCLFFAF